MRYLNLRATIYALTCVGLWALIPVVSKLGQTNLDNHQFLFWSSLISFVSFIVALILTKKYIAFKEYTGKNLGIAIILGFLGTYLYYILLYFGYAHAQGLEVLIIQYSWPIFIVLFSALFLKESINIKRLLAICFGFIGVLLMITKGNITSIYLENFYVDTLVICAALIFALFSVMSKKVHLEEYTMITIYFLTATFASGISMLFFSHFAFPSINALIPILINGILVNGYSYIFWIKALKASDASFVAPFIFLTPVVSTLYLVLFFHEPFLPLYGIGLLAVIIGGILNIEVKK